jgi:hypothetical protein
VTDTVTIPAPPPEDNGEELHVLTLDVARETIEVLKEREIEHLADIATLIDARSALSVRNLELSIENSQLKTELARERAERRQ